MMEQRLWIVLLAGCVVCSITPTVVLACKVDVEETRSQQKHQQSTAEQHCCQWEPLTFPRSGFRDGGRREVSS